MITLLVAWIIFATLVLTLRYAILPHVDNYRGDIERVTGATQLYRQVLKKTQKHRCRH